MKPYRLAVDIGGTFVDAIEFDVSNQSVRLEKSPATPQEPWKGVLEALEKLGTDLKQASLFIHGTTLGLNAILQRKGALTGIITNEGFRDIFEIGRANVPAEHMYNFRYEKPVPLVRRRHTAGVPGRINVKGEVVEELDEKALLEAARTLIEDHELRSLAVVFLHSYKNPEHEQRAARLLKENFPEVAVSISTDITREYREYERTSTTVLDAYIRPIYEEYVDRLKEELGSRGFDGRFLITRSSGGAMTAEVARRSPIFTVMSGPAGGIVGAAHIARTIGNNRLISVDFGGTSLDSCLIEDGKPVLMHEADLEHLPALIPIYDIRSIGAGGGSIAWLEEGLLKVGPQSAGAVPGPIAYGKGGTEPTTTDAALALGYIDPNKFLKGRMELDAEASRQGIDRVIAKPLGIDVLEAAAGMFDVVMANTVGAIREISVERGYDPTEFTLLAFGGAGPMFAPLLAREMAIPQTIVPLAPAAFSAWGMLMSDLAADFSRTDVQVLEDYDPEKLENGFRELEKQAIDALRKQGMSDKEIEIDRVLELRYLGQEHALDVSVDPGLPFEELRKRFEALHKTRYGHTTSDLMQTVNLRVRGRGLMDKPEMTELPKEEVTFGGAILGARDAYCFDLCKVVPFEVYRRKSLQSGDEFKGPAIVDEGTSTTVIHSKQSVRVDPYGQLVIQTEAK